MAKQIWALHTLTGQVRRIDEHILSHAAFAPYLVEVPAGTKSYDPILYKPQTAAEYLASRKKADDNKKSEDKK